MRSGALNKRITIQSAVTSSDGMGHEKIDRWEDEKTIWAGLRPALGREYTDNQQTESQISHEIRTRYRSGITTDKRIKFGDRYFDIVSVINVRERNRELVLMCKEQV